MNQQRQPPAGATALDKKGRHTFHLTPVGVWEAQKGKTFYTPEPFGREGFIHCTDSLAELIAVGNRYYLTDDRPYLALEIDCERVAAPIVYEDSAHCFPHIYGPMEIDAVLVALPVQRERSGEFVEVVYQK